VKEMAMVWSKDRTYDLIYSAQQGNKDAMDTLIEENRRLVFSSLKRFMRSTDFEDIVQIGFIGLIKAIRKFDLTYNVEFSTYAVPMIFGEVLRFLRDDGIVKVTREVKQLARKILITQDNARIELGRKLTVEELAIKFEVLDEIIRLAVGYNAPIRHLDEQVSNNGRDKENILLLDTIEDNSSQKGFQYVELRDMLKVLPERMQHILHLRYFQDMTQCEVAEIFGVSQVQISRIEKRALEALRTNLPVKSEHETRGRKTQPIKITKKRLIFEALDNNLTKKEIMLKFEITDDNYKNYVYEYNKRIKLITPKKKEEVKPEMEKIISKKMQVFEALSKNFSKARIMKDFDISLASYNSYKFQHKKWKEKQKLDELADQKVDELIKDVPALKDAVQNQTMITLTVDIITKHGIVFKDCSIFKPFPAPGSESIQSYTEIQNTFNKKVSSWNDHFIFFQNEWLNATIHVDNVESYKVNVIEN
jgi:RNA polymerase sporulation-specific sigma factor